MKSPEELGGTTISLVVYVGDADDVFKSAVAAGARVDDPVREKPYGDRSGNIIDPFGHRWIITTHMEDVSPVDLERL